MIILLFRSSSSLRLTPKWNSTALPISTADQGVLPQGIDDFEERKAMEVGVAGANRDDAMLAHQDRRLQGRGVSWGSFPFAPAHDRRKSAKSAVWCSWCRGGSRSTIVVDGGSPGGVDAKGDACVAPTQIGPYPPGRAYRGAPWGSFPFAPAHDRRKSAPSAVSRSRCWGGRGRQSWSTVVHLEVLTQRATHASPLHR